MKKKMHLCVSFSFFFLLFQKEIKNKKFQEKTKKLFKKFSKTTDCFHKLFVKLPKFKFFHYKKNVLVFSFKIDLNKKIYLKKWQNRLQLTTFFFLTFCFSCFLCFFHHIKICYIYLFCFFFCY